MEDYQQMRQLGLSRTAVICYENLYQSGIATASELAGRLQTPRTSIYHALYKLEAIGFVERQKATIFPEVTRFRAVRLDKALENLAIYQRRAVSEIVERQIGRSIKQQAQRGRPQPDWR